MPKIIGFCGKGGTGKTTLSALALKKLLEKESGKRILAIDSDPNECLPKALGVSNYTRLSDIEKKYEGKSLGPIEFEDGFRSVILMSEQENYDILVMGRGEGEGCYCLINTFLRQVVEKNVLSGKFAYDYVLIDCEAGLEHISRKTSASINDLIMIADSSKMSILTIERIKNVSKEVQSEVKNFYVVGNRVQSKKIEREIKKLAEKLGITFLGIIPHDPWIEKFDDEGKGLLGIPNDSEAYCKMSEILDKILQ